MTVQLAKHSSLSPRTTSRFDAVSILTVYVVALIAIPSKFVVAPLGGAGTPAQILAVGCLVWYVWDSALSIRNHDAGRQPVRRAMLFLVGAFLASYIAAMTRVISSAETSTADLGLFCVLGWLGVVLVASGGVSSEERLRSLLGRVSALGGALATLGIVQFFTGQPWTDRIQIPGLTINLAFNGINGRDGFTRPAGTAIHAIEFGVVLAMILPIAVTHAMQTNALARPLRWYPVLAIAIAIPLSISRSAVIATAVALAILLPTWPNRARWVAAIATIGVLLLLFLAVPGFLGAITALFTGANTDASVQSRTGSYTIAWEFIQEAPLFGRGFSTFSPSYWTLDNQYLGLLIETGIVGFAAFLMLVVCGILSIQKARRLTTDPVTRAYGQAVCASTAAGATATAFYDLLAFPMSAGLLFLMLGVSGAFYRLSTQETQARSS